jgi:glycosyltransferase involved in cell wall biosynthesis
MRVLLVTSEGACGIAEHSKVLREAVHAADSTIEFFGNPEWLDPQAIPAGITCDVLHLNYHAALHSRWTPTRVLEWRGGEVPVVITYHDTGVPNSDQAKALHAVADAFVVHEPADDLPGAIYWRQGVPDFPYNYLEYYAASDAAVTEPDEFNTRCFKQWCEQPVVGTVGFPFPWKNYDLLAEASFAAGWALVLLAPTATPADVARWRALNPWSLIRTDFVPADEVVAHLAGCDATAFLYACANTGTSGAIRQGLAARKPVLATTVGGCRQFRDLDRDPVASRAIRWLPTLTVPVVADALSAVPLGRVDPGVVRAAHQDSWASLGVRYAALYRRLISGEHA